MIFRLPHIHTHSDSPAPIAGLTAHQQRAILMGKLSRVLLFCYILTFLKPVMPIIADMLAHTFWEQQHMMAVHEVNGKFHIHGELGRAAHQSDNEKSNDLKYEVEQYLYTAPDLFQAMVHTAPAGAYILFSRYFPAAPHRDILSPPPQPSLQDRISEAMNDGSLFRA